MNLTYNDFAIHEIGEFTVSQSREIDDSQRAKVTLKIGVALFNRTYGANYAAVLSLKEALRTQQAVLQWTNTDTGDDYINQTVMLQSDDLPDEWGTYQMAFNLVFSYYEQDLITNNMPMVLTAAVGAPLNLGSVSKFKEDIASERFSPYHSNRSITKGSVSVSGYLLADATIPLADRRTALISQATALRAALTQAEGVLTFGVWSSGNYLFNRTIRVESASVESDQLHYAITWSFTAIYTIYPNEGDFATVEYQADQKDANTGEQFLTFSGKIMAQTEAAARAKLGTLTATVIAQYGYSTASQQLRNDSNASQVSANADGDTFTELTFSIEYRKWRSDNQSATFTKTGGSTPIPFGNVKTWEMHYSARRFSDLRSQRQRAGGTISASGTWCGDPTLTVAERRTQILAAQQAMMTEVNNADGTLAYGSFSQVVRVEELKAEINQAITAIDWSFTGQYSLFPNEAGYATVDFTVNQVSSAEDGEESLTFSGTILAPDESLARAKLDALRTAMLTSYGYNINQQLRPQSNVRSVYANGDKTQTLTGGFEASDGTTFIELTFTEEYRRRRASLVSWTMQTSSRKDVSTGLVISTFSGTVIASGSSADAAYATAAAKASSLGGSQQTALGGNAALRNSQLNWDTRQIQTANVVEFVRLSFSYEYQSKIGVGSAYLEVNTDTTVETFGVDTVNVSGFVVASDYSTASSIYQAQVRTAYNSKVVHGERTAKSQVMFQSSGASYITQDIKLDFSFSVFSPKATGTTNYRYAISVSNDYLTLTKSTRIRGSVVTATETAADTAITSLLASLATGSLVRDERSVDHEYTSASTLDVYMKKDFESEYVDRITGLTGVLECQVTESVRYTGIRWIVQQIPRLSNGTGGISIPQDGGLQEGSRTVRGTVTATSLAIAQSWARVQREFLTGDNDSNFFPQPEEMDNGFEFVPRTDGVAIGGGANVRLYRVNFSFSEILPDYLPPV